MHTLATVDMFGVAAVVAAIGSATAAVIGALNHQRAGRIEANTSTNGDPRTLGQLVQDTATATGAVPPTIDEH